MIVEKLNIEELLISVGHSTSEFLDLISTCSEEDINSIPFESSWTAAQVADHVTRSNNALRNSLQQRGKMVSRSIDESVPSLKDIFLNFEKKLQSPRFILPTRRTYEMQAVLSELKTSIEGLKQVAWRMDYSEGIDHPIFGEITKFELLHFVMYHTQRHTHQLKNILQHLQTKTVSNKRKVILLIHASLDGFVAGLNGETDWITIDDQIFEDSNSLAKTADIALYGRSTFQMMESYWPGVLTNANSTESELEHARWMERVNKIVFSKTLENVEWNNTRLIRENITDEIMRLKKVPGGNMIIIGSPCLAHSFMERGLIDEYRINVNPVVLGEGISLFKNIGEKMDLRLLQSKTFDSGVVGLLYEKKI